MQIARMRMPAFFCIENHNDILANLFLKSYPSALSGSGERVEAYLLITARIIFHVCFYRCIYVVQYLTVGYLVKCGPWTNHPLQYCKIQPTLSLYDMHWRCLDMSTQRPICYNVLLLQHFDPVTFTTATFHSFHIFLLGHFLPLTFYY